jgi:hypothetical protein
MDSKTLIKNAEKKSIYKEFNSLVSHGQAHRKFIYASREKRTSCIKIGQTNNLKQRLGQMNTFSYYGFKYLTWHEFEGDTYGLERRIKHSFAKLDVNHGKGTEMFRIVGTDKELIRIFDAIVLNNMKELIKKYSSKKAQQDAENFAKFNSPRQLNLLRK